MAARVLVIDDEGLIRTSLHAALAGEGYDASSAPDVAAARSSVAAAPPDVVLLDLRLGADDGLEFLAELRREVPDAKVIVVTAHSSLQSAVQAMRLGAYDFIRKPFELEEILAAVRNALKTSRLERRVEYLDGRERGRLATSLVNQSAAMKRVADEVAIIAGRPVPVCLVLGESGTGKQLVSRMLHDLSDRASASFVELNCSAIPDTLVESELFGHERGAFSDARERKLGLVEVADGGTLFLDEVGDLGLSAQAKLLTFIENTTFRRLGSTATRKVDVRIVAATNRDLPAMVADKTFRQDLWYRLNAISLRLPALRERREDVAPLAEHFLAEATRQFRRRWTGISQEASGILTRYRWPGNVRELRSTIGRAALLNDDVVLAPRHLPAELVAASLAEPPSVVVTPGVPETAIPTLEQVELAHILRVLEVCGGNRTLAAQHLGITRQTLSKKIESPTPEG